MGGGGGGGCWLLVGGKGCPHKNIPMICPGAAAVFYRLHKTNAKFQW